MEGKYISVTADHGVFCITIDRPPLNALNKYLLGELITTFEDLADQEQLRSVVLTGKGEKAFVGGADISEVKDMSNLEGSAFSAQGQSMTNAIENCPVPVICAINGVALGGGCEIALACDIRVMAEKAIIGLPEAGLALLPGAGGTQRLPRVISRGMASLLLFSAKPISAEEAHRCGLVQKVVAREVLMDICLELARQIASNGPLAVRAIKLLLRKFYEPQQERGMILEQKEFGKLCASQDKLEGITAFFEKRKPVYTGK